MGIPLLREGAWKETPQHCCNPSTNYPWYCFNNQQHPFNDGLRKQGGFICINTVYIWYTMDWPANGLLITNMHILSLRPSVLPNFAHTFCVSHVTNRFLLASWRGRFKFHACSIDCIEESCYKFLSYSNICPTRCNVTQFIFFFLKTALHVSGGTTTHHQERKDCIYSIWYLSHRYCYLPLSWKSWNSYAVPTFPQKGENKTALCRAQGKAARYKL